MATSKITKIALANSLKELMAEMPFQKISVGQIAEKCNLNRKSFYYHFKDKYDLINWIFDTEFKAILQRKNYECDWDIYENLIAYFYDNRAFYRKALEIKGQNSFFEHFNDRLRTFFSGKQTNLSSDERFNEFYTNFFADAFICSIERWIMTKNCLKSDEFARLLRTTFEKSTINLSIK